MDSIGIIVKFMKKTFFISLFVLLTNVCSFAQKQIVHQSQSRVIEPMQDVFIRPLVADLEIIKQELTEYAPVWQCQGMKVSEITNEQLINAKTNALYVAAAREGADIIVAATFEVISHRDEKGQFVDNDGLDIIVRGYPAKYVNWHKMGESPEDSEWFKNLIDAQLVRNSAGNVSDVKTEAVTKNH